MIDTKVQKKVDERDKKLEKKKANKEKTLLALDVEGVVDVLDDGDKLVYLMDDGTTKDSISIDETVFTPPAKEDLPYAMAPKNKVLAYIKDSFDTIDSFDGILWDTLIHYHKETSELPNDLYYDLLALWDLHTYLIEKIHFSPILYFYAVKERGKSRTGKACIYVSRRGVFTESVREADIIRWGNDHRAALGFDVKDFPRKMQRANCDDLLLSRFEKGAIASRTLFPDKGAFRDTKTFKLFGPTIVMTNRPVDDILESRAISIDMKPTKKRYNSPVLEEEAQDLKARLVAFRFRHKDLDFGEIDKPADGRLGDILAPLHKIVVTIFPNKIRRFEKLVQVIALQKKSVAVDTFDGKVVQAIIEVELLVQDSFISTEDVTKAFNKDKKERFHVRNETIGKKLKALGFSLKTDTKGQKRGVFYDPELVDDLATQYGINQEEESEKEDVPMPKKTVKTVKSVTPGTKQKTVKTDKPYDWRDPPEEEEGEELA